MDVSYLLDDLNPAQREAVTAPPGHYLVLAGAGSGKTRVLTHRIAWLNEVDRRAGARHPRGHVHQQGRRRDARAAPMRCCATAVAGMWIGTFHGLAHRLLRLHWQRREVAGSIPGARQRRPAAPGQARGAAAGTGRGALPAAADRVVDQRAEGRRPAPAAPAARRRPVDGRDARAYALYQERCDRAGLVDFAELLLRAHELLRDNAGAARRITGIASATSAGRRIPGHQRDPVRLRAPARRRHAATCSWSATTTRRSTAGAARRWRTCSASCAIFPARRRCKLEQNYRSTANILNAANAVIAHNPDRLGKQLWTDGGDGEPIDLYAAYNEIDEARYVIERIRQWVRDGGSHGDSAILYRSNAQSRAFEEALLAEQMPYRVYGGQRFFERAEIKDTLAYLRLVANRARRCRVRARGQHAARAASASARSTKCASARARDSVSLWEAARAIARRHRAGRRARAMRWRRSCADRSAVRWKPRELPLQDKIDHVLVRSGLREYYANESQRPAAIRAPRTSTNWSRSPRASCSATTTRKPRR